MIKVTDKHFSNYCKDNFYNIILKYISKKEASYFYSRVLDQSLFDVLADPEQLYNDVLNLSMVDNYNLHLRSSIVQGTKVRDLYRAKPHSLVVTVVIASFLSQHLEPIFSDSLYSFRKGRGRELALKDLVFVRKENKDKASFYQGDVSGYGDNIDQNILIEKISKFVDIDSRLFSVLKAFISISYVDNDVTCVMRKGIPTGSPLTPVFENIYLMSLDQLVKVDLDVNYFRYGDDLLLISSQEASIREGSKRIIEHLKAMSLEIKPSKEFFHYSSDKSSQYTEWLGFAFNEHLSLTSRKRYQDEFKRDFKKRINLHLLNLKQFSLDHDELISKTLDIYSDLVNPFKSPLAYKYLLFTELDMYVKQLDFSLREYVVKLLHRKTNISKSKGFAALRSRSDFSLNFYRRILDKKRRERYFL